METKNENVKLMLGNNIDRLKELPDNFVDSIVTDPPYGIIFYGIRSGTMMFHLLSFGKRCIEC
jgi:tRNA G10  N-methylase Trm11